MCCISIARTGNFIMYVLGPFSRGNDPILIHVCHVGAQLLQKYPRDKNGLIYDSDV